HRDDRPRDRPAPRDVRSSARAGTGAGGAHPLKLAKLGLLIAYPAFALTFRGPRARFWDRMTATGAVLGTLAIAGDRSLQRPRLRPKDVALGLGIAAGLYAIFQVGD